MYFSLFKETKNFDFYCMFFSAVCVAQGYHITYPFTDKASTLIRNKTIESKRKSGKTNKDNFSFE